MVQMRSVDICIKDACFYAVVMFHLDKDAIAPRGREPIRELDRGRDRVWVCARGTGHVHGSAHFGTAIGKHYGLHRSGAFRVSVGKHSAVAFDKRSVPRHSQIRADIASGLASGVEQTKAKRVRIVGRQPLRAVPNHRVAVSEAISIPEFALR
jgi:hypothetical protein